MKAVRRLSIFLIPLVAAVGCNNNSPSKEETFTWMQQTLAAHNGLHLQDVSPDVQIVGQLTHHGCQLEYVAVKGDWTYYTDVAGIDPNSLKIEKIGRAPWVTFRGRNSQHVVKEIDPLAKLPRMDSEAGGFSLDSQEYAERFLNALKHAVILCGGKPSTF